MTMEKAIRAQKQTDRIRKVKEEHLESQKQQMEKVFSEYVQRRLKAEKKVVRISDLTVRTKC